MYVNGVLIDCGKLFFLAKFYTARKVYNRELLCIIVPFIDIIGYAAGSLILVSTLPQIIKSWRTKSTKDISLMRCFIYFIGVLVWLIYGIILVNGPMIIVNSINLILESCVIYFKIKYG